MERDLIERLRKFIATKGLMLPASEFEMLALVANELDRIAALEAEASEGERRGLERAAEVADQHLQDRQRSWRESRVDLEGSRSLEAKDIAIAIRALIPEAPAQRELASSAANQISTPEVGLPEAPAEGWQPIETAPTNRAIQIHVPSLDYYGNGGVYAGMLVDMGTGRRWMTFGWAIGRDLGHENTPTHWRPLPPPPSQDREPDSQRGAK